MLKVVAVIPLSLLAIVTLGAARLPDQMPSATTLGSTDAAEHATYETGSTSPASKGVRWPGLSCAIAAHGRARYACDEVSDRERVENVDGGGRGVTLATG